MKKGGSGFFGKVFSSSSCGRGSDGDKETLRSPSCVFAQLPLLWPCKVEASRCAGGGRAPTCQEVKAELIKMGNDLNLLRLNPFSSRKPQTFEAKILVGVRPHLCCRSEVEKSPVTHL